MVKIRSRLRALFALPFVVSNKPLEPQSFAKMSIGSPRLDDNVHRKRQRTASQDSIERRPAKKARSGPHQQLSCKTINLSATSFPRQSTTRRAVTEVGHNTKQDWLDFLGTSEGRHCLPNFPLPSAKSPQRLPLTEESLRLLDNGCRSSGSKESEMSTSYPSLDTSPSDKAINAYDPEYLKALYKRRVFFANGFPGERPPGLDELWEVLLASRKSPEPDQDAINALREHICDATTERATVEGVVPKLIPIDALTLNIGAISVTDMVWKSALNTELKPSLTAPKPDRTIGWRSSKFAADFPKACASLDAFIFPVIGAQGLAWPLFTVEANERGSRRVCRLQNLHNGAVMLSNLYALKQKCSREEEFFDKVHAMGVEFFDSSVQLSCYWATRTKTGEISYRGETLQTWTLLDIHGHGYKQARLCIHNAIDWVRDQAHKWICSDLQAVEDMLNSVPLSRITGLHQLMHGPT